MQMHFIVLAQGFITLFTFFKKQKFIKFVSIQEHERHKTKPLNESKPHVFPSIASWLSVLGGVKERPRCGDDVTVGGALVQVEKLLFL